MKRYFIYAFGLLLLASCSAEIDGTIVEDGESVEVSFSLSVDSEKPGTRAVNDPTDVGDTEIKNVWVIQFNGTADDAKLIGRPTYIEKYDEEETSHSVELIASSSEQTIVFLANTYDDKLFFPNNYTFGDLKKETKKISRQEDLLGLNYVEGNDNSFPTGDFHLMLNGSSITAIEGNTHISCSLTHNIARIDFTLKHFDGLTIKSVLLKSVPAVSLYYTSGMDGNTPFPAPGSFKTVDFEEPAKVTPNDDGSTSYLFYSSVNQRGSVANEIDAYKNIYAPYNSTYLLVDATYQITEGEQTIDMPITYSFYLGENLHDDFNLKPNHTYSYNVSINTKGDSKTDSRVGDWGMVDYTTREAANCYILTPSPVSGYKSKYRIPISRVNEFWGPDYEDMSNYLIEGSTGWEVFVIWADFDYATAGVDISTRTGTGPTLFEVEVPTGAHGNMVVGIRNTTANTPTLWSWHLWITDYNPDMSDYYTPIPGQYIYNVTNGEVHRYADDPSYNIWGDGSGSGNAIYEKSFIMDRSLGAMDAGYSSCLYYQYGRKDPFVNFNTTLYGPDGSNPPEMEAKLAADANTSMKYHNMRLSVMHPMYFYCGDIYWTLGDKYNPTEKPNPDFVWQDPKAEISTTDIPVRKSLFDPCPPGWCVPVIKTWNDFRSNSVSKPSTNIYGGSNPKRGFTPFSKSDSPGLRYWPYTDDGNVPDEIYYPRSGYIQHITAATVGDACYYWSSTPNRNDDGYSKGYYFGSNISSIATEGIYAGQRANAMPVRCVKITDR